MTLHRLRAMPAAREPIAMLTCYDASFARIEDAAGVDVMLVGDSLGQVLQGRESTLAVTVDEMAYHTACVARGNRNAWLIADLPFAGYHASPAGAFANAAKLMQAGAQMVKLEGAGWAAETTRFLVDRGVPVCAHLGFTPQSVHALGGYRVQGRGEEGAARLAAESREVAEAGAAMLILEMVPAVIARAVTEALPIPTVGIGAGAGCGGQVLVLHDMLGITQGRMPRFVRDFMTEGGSVEAAIRRYVVAVKDGSFPEDAVHGY